MIDADNKEYLAAAKGWEADGVVRAKRSERIAWRIAIAGVIVALAAVAAVAGLAPFKEVEPFVIRVDKNTGYTDIITRVDEQSMTPNEAIDKFFLSDYVRAREGYSNAFAYSNYEKIGLMSAPTIGKKYYAAFRPENDKSPLNTHGQDGTIDVKVMSISFIDEGVASVRFSQHDENKGQERDSRWIATVAYTYENPPLTEAERLINPLGFQVISYRVDAETVGTTRTAGAQ